MGEAEIVPAADLEEAGEQLARAPSQALLVNEISLGRGLECISGSAMLPDGTPAIICSIPGLQGASAALGISERLVKPVSRAALLDALDHLSLKDGTVLIVDDEPDALQLFGRALVSSGRDYRVLLARDGQEALCIIHECRPDVILLDLIMPNMDGFQLLEMRQHDPALREIPVIVISARDPGGQPIVSSALAVTRGGGLSAQHLLTSIRFLSRTLSVADRVAGPMPTAIPPV